MAPPPSFCSSCLTSCRSATPAVAPPTSICGLTPTVPKVSVVPKVFVVPKVSVVPTVSVVP